MAKTVIIVAGSWGTALAKVLADNGHEVLMWSRNPQQIKEINETHRSRGFKLPRQVKATDSMAEAISGAQAVVIVAPSSAMRQIAASMRPYVRPEMIVIHATKGFEGTTLKRMSTVISEEIPHYPADRIVVLSGPSHAEEVVNSKPTTVVVAAYSPWAAEAAQSILMNSLFRVYTNSDVLGVEISGALKNIIALGSGLSDGLGFGDNAKAALVTRGLAEISRLGTEMGANPLTFSGLAGVGDLIVTCTSQHSRNWRAGYLLAQGKTVEETQAEVGAVIEGIKTTEAAYSLSRRFNVNMPIATELYYILFRNKSVKTAVEDLMGRDRTSESIHYENI